MIGSYQLNDYNHDPEICVMAHVCDGTSKNLQLCLLGNMDKGVGWYHDFNSEKISLFSYKLCEEPLQEVRAYL